MTTNSNLVNRVKKEALEGEPDTWGEHKRIVRTIDSYYFHPRDDKLVVTQYNLWTGVRRDTNKRWWRYIDNGVRVVKRSNTGFLTYKIKKPDVHWMTSATPIFATMDADTLDQIYGGVQMVFPHAYHWNIIKWQQANHIYSELNAALQSPTEIGIVDRLFGVRRNNDRLCKAVLNSPQIHLLFAHYLRGLVPNEQLIEFLETNSGSGEGSMFYACYMPFRRYDIRREFRQCNMKFFKNICGEPVRGNELINIVQGLNAKTIHNANKIKTWDKFKENIGWR